VKVGREINFVVNATCNVHDRLSETLKEKIYENAKSLDVELGSVESLAILL
jgi:hypothetical protein